jgi:hypothetical protein
MSWEKFVYKLSKDLLISLIITYFFISIPELILPGLISAHFSPKYLLATIIVLGWFFARPGRKFSQQENTKFKAISRNLLNVILFIVTIMLILSLFKMRIWQIIIVVIFSVILFITAENMLISEEEGDKVR